LRKLRAEKRARRDELDRDLGETMALEVERNPRWASCTKEQQPAMGGGGQASWGWPTALGLDVSWASTGTTGKQSPMVHGSSREEDTRRERASAREQP